MFKIFRKNLASSISTKTNVLQQSAFRKLDGNKTVLDFGETLILCAGAQLTSTFYEALADDKESFKFIEKGGERLCAKVMGIYAAFYLAYLRYSMEGFVESYNIKLPTLLGMLDTIFPGYSKDFEKLSALLKEQGNHEDYNPIFKYVSEKIVERMEMDGTMLLSTHLLAPMPLVILAQNHRSFFGQFISHFNSLGPNESVLD